MKTAFRWLKPILCFAMLALLASCAYTYTPYKPNDSAVHNISVKQAREVLATQLRESALCNKPVDQYCLNKITDVHVTSTSLTVMSKGKQSIFIFKDLPEVISQRGNDMNMMGDFQYVVLSTQPEVGIWRNDFDQNNAIANALYVLKRDAIKRKDAAELDARFATSLADYRKKAASNAALPEEANRYKVQAEGAVRDKAFDDAADFYAEALKIAPWWPVGRFNRALILGEIGEYAEAMREMNYYLQLLPDAPNARAAQDKIYEWERLESK